MNWLKNLFGIREVDFNYPSSYSEIMGVSPLFNDYCDDLKKMKAVFENPAVLKVFALQCDLFSLGRVIVKKKGGGEIKDDPFLEMMKNPNPFQTQSQFLWDYMFWVMLGNSYCCVDSNILTPDNKLYFLEHQKMEWPNDMEKLKDKLLISKKSLSDLDKINITYRYEDRTSITIPLKQIQINYDLTNGSGNWFKGRNRIDSLVKVITNSDEALKSNNINIRYAGKFMVAGMQDPNNVAQLPMGEIEKQDIETKMNGRKQVHATKTMIDIKRFVEDRRGLDLDKAYLDQYFIIGSMYGIPRDVLEAYVSSTYENQEKARASHVTYTLQPKGNDFFQGLAKRFGYDIAGKEIFIDWSHLPFMQVFERDRALTNNTNIQTLTALLKLNVDIDDANYFLGTNFKTASYAAPTTNAPAIGGS